VSTPITCSWSLKKLLKIRDLAKNFIHFKVGDGSRVFLWLDKWHPAGYLLDRFGYRIVYDSGIPLNAKLAAIMKDGEWFWGSVRPDDLVAIQSQLSDVVIGDADVAVWDSRNGTYSCADTWGKL
jgi:hypothetical protein